MRCSLSSTAPRAVTALLATVVMLSACTGDGGGSTDGAAAGAAESEQAVASVVLAHSEDAPTPLEVLPAGTVEAAAVALSRALVASSPAAVVVTAADTEAVTAAIQAATENGLPVLPLAEPASTLVLDELDRLGAETLLAVDAAAASVAEAAAGDRTVVTEADDLPDIERGEALSATTVLTTGAPTDALALGTAAAAGATVVTVPTGDPRASAEAVTALAAAAPDRTLALGATFGSAEALAPRLATAVSGAQLPGGGQLVLADRRYVALYGHPGTAALGVLGEQSLGKSVTRARKLASDYDKVSDLPVVPTFEIITTVATRGAGKDGNYSNEVDPAVLAPWVEEAGRQGVYVLLDLQPGRSDFLTQAKRYESLLAHPHVGLALDPEWRLEPDERHLAQIGSVTAAEVNATSAWLAEFTRTRALPQKMLVLHQFTTSMISDRQALDTTHDELAIVIHADGHGGRGAKTATWNKLRENAPAGVTFAWKNFIDEDDPTYTPAETMAIEPTPVLVSYQ